MTKTYGFWKRLGALLLAFALVVSMCPVKASAAETKTATPLQLTLQRIDRQYAYSNVDFWNSHKDILGEYPQSEPSNLRTERYLYYVRVPDVASEINIYWTADVNAATSESDRFPHKEDYITIKDNVATASFSTPTAGAGGVWVGLAKMTLYTNFQNAEAPYEMTTAVWASDTYVNEVSEGNRWRYTKGNETFPRDFYYGIPVTLISKPDGNSGVDSGDVIAENVNGDYFKAGEQGTLIPIQATEKSTVLLTRNIYYPKQNDADLRQVQQLVGKIVYPKYDPIFKVAGIEYKSGSKVYLAKDAEMTITVDNTNLGAVEMPPVDDLKWDLNEETNQWVGTMSKAKTVELGDEKIEVIVDTQKPKFDNVMAYMNGENAVVQFDVTAVSGVKTVTINGKEQNAEAASVVNNVHSYAITVPGMKEGDTAAIEVTSMAGAPQTVTATVGADLYFGTALVGATLKDETNNIVTIDDANAHVKVYLYGAKVGGVGVPSVTSVVEKHGEKTSVVTGTTAGQWTRSYALGTSGNASGITLTATDMQGRSVENFPVPVYIVDSEAPTYEITVNGTPYDKEIITKETTTVTVTVKDDVLLPAVKEDDVVHFTGTNVDKKVTFTKNGAGQYVASVELTGDPAEQKLTGITSTVSDVAGFVLNINESPDITVDKTAPVVEVTFSDNVQALKEFNNRMFAVLAPVDNVEENTADIETVEMTYIYTDFIDGEKTDKYIMNVEKHGTNSMSFSIPASDTLGNHREKLPISVTYGSVETSLELKINEAKTAYEGTLYADRRIPGESATGIPKVTFQPAIPAGKAGDKDLHKGSEVKFQAVVTDGSANTDADSGIEKIEWTVSSNVENFLSLECADFDADNITTREGTYNITLRAAAGYETKDAVLTAHVYDKAGNHYAHTYYFAHDNCAPRVTVTKAGEGNYVDNVEYIKSAMTYKVTVEDMFLDTSNVAIKDSASGVAVAESKKTDSVHTYTVSVAGDLKADDITITAKDKADYVPTSKSDSSDSDFDLKDGTYVNNNAVIFDDVAPVVLVTRNNEPINAAYGVDYHTGPVTYSFTVTDAHLTHKEGTTATLRISYKLDGKEETEVKLPVTVDSDKLLWDNATGKDVYTYSFTLADETKTLTDMSIEVKDNAGNDHVMDAAANCLSFEKGTYTGNDAIVDMTAPKVTVERTGTAVNKTDDYGYFDEDVKYTITVEEANFDPDSKVILSGENLKNTELSFQDQKVEFTLTDTMQLDDMQIAVIDYAKHKPATINENVDDEAYQGSGDYQWTADSKHVIVDQTAPTATLTITSTQDVLDKYFTHTKDGVEYYYLKLTDPTGNTKENVTITATLTVKDRNLLNEKDFLVNNASSSANQHEGWDLTGIMVNDDACVATYSTKVEVPYDSTGLVKLDLAVKDAVNKPVDANITVDSVNNTTLAGEPFQTSGDKINSTIIMDRRRPTSDVESIPEIKIVPVTGTTLKLANNTELYNFNPSFYVNVQDGMAGTEDILHAGLSSVNISMENAGPTRGQVLSFAGVKKNYTESGVYQFEQTLALDGGEGECNDYNLTVVAEDNVGNVITVARKFAVDTMAPQVTVEYDNNQVLNDFYFRDDRIATITVEDINFSGADTKINTQVTPSAWVKGDDRITNTATCVYDTDGDYTFAMSSKDLAGNETGDDQVKYDGAAPKKFTVDKTNPVITVSFSPKHTNEFGGLWYYADLTNATVTIDEHNFRAADVAPVFRLAGNVINYVKLGDFTSTGDTHHANAAFSDGNDYDFTITYSDLAGNPAIPYNTDPHFSVDSKDPKIAMSRGDMTADGVNVVSGDIDLQFRITDEEKNLADYTVKLTHLNNEFETYVITEKDNYRDWFSVDKQDDENTIYVTMANLPKEKDYDGIYTIEITGIDHAGNKTVMDAITYSVNRFGSTFQVDDAYTAQFLKLGADGITYHNSVDNKLIVKEINPNEVFHTVENKTVRGSMLTVVANGVSRQLVEGKDYTMTVVPDHKETGDKVETWYTYTYEIDPSVFQDENGFISGRYAILFYSEDAAGNKNTNEANISSTVQENANGEYTGKMEFVLDTMPPVITTTGIESNKVYNAEFQRMEILVSDTTPTGIQVFLNGTEVALSDAALADTAAWLVLDELTGVYTLNVPEQNELFGSQYVSVIAKDAAGNAAEALVEDFNVSTSLLVRLVHNGWIIVGGGLGIAALIFLLIQWKKKKV